MFGEVIPESGVRGQTEKGKRERQFEDALGCWPARWATVHHPPGPPEKLSGVELIIAHIGHGHPLPPGINILHSSLCVLVCHVGSPKNPHLGPKKHQGRKGELCGLGPDEVLTDCTCTEWVEVCTELGAEEVARAGGGLRGCDHQALN